MKITYTGHREREFGSITEAVDHATTPDAYSYEGQLERLSQENEKLRELVGRLCTVIFDKETIGTDTSDAGKLEHVLGYNYKVW